MEGGKNLEYLVFDAMRLAERILSLVKKGSGTEGNDVTPQPEK